jgi:hypothetical protein
MPGRQRYVGSVQHLRGKSALVRPREGIAGQVMAQFEDYYLQEARDWWQFAATDFDSEAHFHTHGEQAT